MTIEQTIYQMLTTDTGTNIMDSGGDNGRNWQRNQTKTIEDFENQPEAYIDDWYLQMIEQGDTADSSDLNPTVSLYHHLTNSLEIDDACKQFNSMAVDNWDSDAAYGLSEAGEQWLIDQRLTIEDTWNSYNGESNLSQVVQGANINVEGDALEFPTYILLQIHQGADVRGGYTDAKLFKVSTGSGYFDTNPGVYGNIDDVEVTSGYNGYSLTDEDGEVVPVNKDSKIEVYLSEN